MYVVSKKGTFGKLGRLYRSEVTGKDMATIIWGPLGWVTPVNYEDLHLCGSHYYSEALQEAIRWLEMQEALHGQSSNGQSSARAGTNLG